jgi:hypothetical protein
MLQKISQAAWLILMVYSMQLFCMEEVCRYRPKIKVSQKDDELIYYIEKTIGESLDDLFREFIESSKNGQFDEAKHWLESFCNDQISNLQLNDAKINCSINHLKELLEEFDLRSKFLLKHSVNNFDVIKIGCHDTLRFMGLVLAFCIGIAGACVFDSGIILIAFAVATLVCYDSISFFLGGMLFATIAALDQPDLVFNLTVFISVTLALCLRKIISKKIERSKEFKEIEKIVLSFKEKLTQHIQLHPNDLDGLYTNS